MTEIEIREMQEYDISRVLEIERLSFTSPWTWEAFLNEIYKNYSLTRVAVYEGAVVGYICINFVLNEGHILNLAVHPDFRRLGIATLLMNEGIRELKKKGCAYLYLEVRVSNFAAIKFYERFGLRSVGTRKKYYSSPGEDALLMMGLL